MNLLPHAMLTVIANNLYLTSCHQADASADQADSAKETNPPAQNDAVQPAESQASEPPASYVEEIAGTSGGFTLGMLLDVFVMIAVLGLGGGDFTLAEIPVKWAFYLMILCCLGAIMGAMYCGDILTYVCLDHPTPATLEMSASERQRRYNHGRVYGVCALVAHLAVITLAIWLIYSLKQSRFATRFPPVASTRGLVVIIVLELLQIKGLISTAWRVRKAVAEWRELRVTNPELSFADYAHAPIGQFQATITK